MHEYTKWCTLVKVCQTSNQLMDLCIMWVKSVCNRAEELFVYLLSFVSSFFFFWCCILFFFFWPMYFEWTSKNAENSRIETKHDRIYAEKKKCSYWIIVWSQIVIQIVLWHISMNSSFVSIAQCSVKPNKCIEHRLLHIDWKPNAFCRPFRMELNISIGWMLCQCYDYHILSVSRAQGKYYGKWKKKNYYIIRLLGHIREADFGWISQGSVLYSFYLAEYRNSMRICIKIDSASIAAYVPELCFGITYYQMKHQTILSSKVYGKLFTNKIKLYKHYMN